MPQWPSATTLSSFTSLFHLLLFCGEDTTILNPCCNNNNKNNSKKEGRMASDYEIDGDSIEDFWREGDSSNDEESSSDGEKKKKSNRREMLDGYGRSKDDLRKSIRDLESKVVQGFEARQGTETETETENKTEAEDEDEPTRSLPIHNPHAYPCSFTIEELPPPPSKWPQAPVMVRPTPGSSTKIRGVRLVGDMEYQNFPGFCDGCILPINNGRERDGDSIVIDFESDHFVGTLLMRIKDIPAARDGTTTRPDSYFDNKKRRFQTIVRGKFKTELKMSDCVTGQVFDRPGGKLPPKWMIKSFIKFITVLAPQLEVDMDGKQPKFMAPLVATAHTVIAKPHKGPQTNGHHSDEDDEHLRNYNIFQGSTHMEDEIEEPPATHETSLMQEVPNNNNNIRASSSTTIASRMKARKKAYNLLAATKSDRPKFSLDKEYTFEFYQHLLIFDGPELQVDMGSMLGKSALASITNGQPLKCNAAVKNRNSNNLLEYIWSFDIWHKSLFPYAQAALSKS